MASERPLTPEKQLLRLIEDPKAKSAPKIEAQAIRYHSQSLFSFGAWQGRISFLKDRFRDLTSAEKTNFDIVKVINGLLGSLIVILAAYFASSFSLALVNQKKTFSLAGGSPQAGKASAVSAIPSNLKDPTYYLDKVSQRNIFKIGAKKVAEAESKGDISRLMELTQSLKLVGISWSNDPDAMIEDTKSTRTFFVKRGQMVGEVKIKDIAKDKVVLTYDGEEMELR
jgi:hypothetical protein